MTLLPQEIIRRKRDGGRLSTEEIEAFVAGIADGSPSEGGWGEGQIGAFAMAAAPTSVLPAPQGSTTTPEPPSKNPSTAWRW